MTTYTYGTMAAAEHDSNKLKRLKYFKFLCFLALFGLVTLSVQLSLERLTPLQQQHSRIGEINLSAKANTSVLIAYATADEMVEKMAIEIARGIQSSVVKIVAVSNATFQDVLWADGVILGSPVINAQVHPDMQEWINTWNLKADLSRKVGAAFVTSAGISAGEELVMLNLLHTMMIFRFIIVGGDKWTSAFGASAIVSEGPFCLAQKEPNQLFLDKAVGLGQRVSEVVSMLKY